ncbi:MAG: Asp-tRNA(Asn)/Glu-tRNA(Gln) amidotransferase subunit GatA [Chloroflexota bacterium]|nr:Asp-tRNA(Asn)/Glu-tRNA(Gln) amidotransferase subunit GatA [Chloroflexota bacterium]
MPANELHQLTIHEAHELLKQRKISSTELTKSVLKRIVEIEGKVQACVTIVEDIALKEAEKLDNYIKTAHEITPLTGIPTLIKDVICTKGIRTTCSSKMLENFVPPYDATVIEKLKAQKPVIVGKTNMDEFAMGSSTEHSAFFPTYNPWDLTRVPGGSSGGSAVAVSTGETIYALGSDTGGSIRQPAGFCNVVGLKPTYGRVSRFGLVAFASSLDQIGPITKDVTDCALVMNVIAGYDSRDSTSVLHPVPDYTQQLIPDIRGLKIGIPREYLVEGVQNQVQVALQAAINKLQELGAEIDWEVSLPHTKYALAAYYILAPSEASANLARYDGVRYGFSERDAGNVIETTERTRQFGFGPEVKRRIMLGTYALSAGYYDAYYLKAQKVRTLIKQEFDQAFEKYDALVTPTSPIVPFKLGEKLEDPMQMYLSDVCTLPINIAGIPAISIPAGFTDNLPIGMQIMGKPFSEEILLRIAFAYEQATDWHKRKPPLS